ncbi:T9SS type B sorting domain-containing protein [Flavobacterium lacus]|uniref:Gliding motility-associated-like protein n=1 Tax=Flavobacterium lacus TaxID=1353778 RepID=A0A328WM03_9FLAO|nr:T9SS type B sorting domain-containing protein [Flavobacterium lacus]RAR47310.1 gliding motility-associated-like protein [Flavobacterium lacus]
MKYFIITLLFCLIGSESYSQFTPRKFENNQGRIIVDSVEISNILSKRKYEIEYNKNFSKNTILAQNSYHLCRNGGFEEFELNGTVYTILGFEYSITNPLNPTECRTLQTDSDLKIPQYNPNFLNVMSTSVPSNYIDEFIGNINGFDQYVLKVNHKNSYNTSSVIQGKRFKTNNENLFKFNYKAVLQSINEPGHDNEQPFFKVRILKNNGTVVSEFCLIGDPNNCIFTQAPTLAGGSIVLYNSNWQSGILDISGLDNNEEFIVEFIGSRCGLGGHFGYVYIDDICLLQSSENLQGSIELNPLYKVCPTFPISVCGTFTLPNSGGISSSVASITLNVLNENNSVVYTNSNPTINLVNQTFCFDLVATNLPNITTGNYNVNVTINFTISDTNCDGTSFNSAFDDDANPGWDITFLNCNATCDFTVTPATLTSCDGNNDGKDFFNLELANSQLTSDSTGITFTYHSNYNGAFANTNPIATPTAYESYTAFIFVRLTKDATCFKIITIQLNVRNPQATISGILNVCSGSTVLTASSGGSYLWSNGATTQSTTVTSTGSYSVSVTDSFGCNSVATISILPNQTAVLPDLLITQPTCSTSTGSITVTSSASQISYDGGLTWSTNPQANNLSVGTYSVRIRTAAGCESFNSTVNIVPFFNTYPSLNFEQPTICGDLGTITITSSASEYSFDDGATWTTNNVLTNAIPGNYFIRTKDSQGCISNPNLVIIYAEFLNNPDYIFNHPYCGTLGSIIFTTEAAEYSIDAGANWQTSNEFLNLDIGSYVLKIKNDLGCTSPNDYVYLYNFEDTYTAFVIDHAGCNKYATLTITTFGEEYSFDGGATWTTNNTITNINGPLIFQVIAKKDNCFSIQSSANVYSSFLPLPIVTDFNSLVCDNFNNGTENIDLSQFNSQLTLDPSIMNFNYFTTLNGAMSNNFSDYIANYTAYNLTSTETSIYVKIIDSNSCFSIAKLDLTLILSPIINLEPLYYLCEDRTVTVTCNSVHDGYSWSTGETTNSIVINQPGIYTLTTTEFHGQIVCSSTQSFDIVLSNPATITYIETKDWTTSENIIQIDATGLGNYEYSLDDINFQDSNLFTNLLSGEYTVFVRDKNGCGTVDQEVFLLMYPLFFTPNGDGYNDKWKIKFSETEPNLTVKIFDRHGKFIKQLGANSEGWDGTFLGRDLPSSDYWFVVTRQNGTEYRGHFSLKR